MARSTRSKPNIHFFEICNIVWATRSNGSPNQDGNSWDRWPLWTQPASSSAIEILFSKNSKIHTNLALWRWIRNHSANCYLSVGVSISFSFLSTWRPILFVCINETLVPRWNYLLLSKLHAHYNASKSMCVAGRRLSCGIRLALCPFPVLAHSLVSSEFFFWFKGKQKNVKNELVTHAITSPMVRGVIQSTAVIVKGIPNGIYAL